MYVDSNLPNTRAYSMLHTCHNRFRMILSLMPLLFRLPLSPLLPQFHFGYYFHTLRVSICVYVIVQLPLPWLLLLLARTLYEMPFSLSLSHLQFISLLDKAFSRIQQIKITSNTQSRTHKLTPKMILKMALK